MEDLYSIYVIIALSVFLLWFFFGGLVTESKTLNKPNKPTNIHRPRDGVYKESRVDRVRRRLKARF